MSKARHQAALKWAAAGRASQARKRAHLPALRRAAPALAIPGGLVHPRNDRQCWNGWAAGNLHDLPVCAPVAVAEHLASATGIIASDAEILALRERTAGGTLGEVIEAADGFAGVRLARFWCCDEELAVDGLIYGVRMPGGYHSVLAHPAGMISWGMLLPRLGIPCETWFLEWDMQ